MLCRADKQWRFFCWRSCWENSHWSHSFTYFLPHTFFSLKKTNKNLLVSFCYLGSLCLVLGLAYKSDHVLAYLYRRVYKLSSTTLFLFPCTAAEEGSIKNKLLSVTCLTHSSWWWCEMNTLVFLQFLCNTVNSWLSVEEIMKCIAAFLTSGNINYGYWFYILLHTVLCLWSAIVLNFCSVSNS